MLLTQTCRRPGTGAAVARALAALAALSIVACGSETHLGPGPSLPAIPPDNPQLTRAAFTFRVNTQTHDITVVAPSTPMMSRAGPSFSLIAGDAITLTPSNYFASSVGQFTPGKIRVRFDVSITNKLGGVQLITPTFPTAPPGVSGVLLVPYATYVTVTSDISVVGSGDTLIIDLPNTGQVAPSVDWDGDGSPGSGSPFNLFNDAACPAGSNDCYRYDVFPAPITPGATTLLRTVGFDIDPAVANFSAKVIVAADLQNSGP